MIFPRSAGILLHPTSLPGAYGIGELGPEALRFCSYLHDSGIKIWQVLPLNPTGYGDSPYQSLSAFAGNPMLISLETMVAEGLLNYEALQSMPDFPAGHVDFSLVIPWKFSLLRKAASNFFASAKSEQIAEFEKFVGESRAWLDDYALFMAAKDAHREKYGLNGTRLWLRAINRLYRDGVKSSLLKSQPISSGSLSFFASGM